MQTNSEGAPVQLSQETLDTLTWLSRLEIPPEEADALSSSIADMLTFFQQLQALDTEGVPPTAHIAPLENVLRDDVAGEPFARTLLLSGTESADGLITLPKVLG